VLGPVATLLRHAGLPSIREQDGRVVISEADANKLTIALPILGRLKRLSPSDDREQAKVFSTWLSFLGVSTQTVAENEDAIGQASRTLDRGGRQAPAVVRSTARRQGSAMTAAPSTPKTIEEAWALAKQQLGLS
jgi:hypothetical protein